MQSILSTWIVLYVFLKAHAAPSHLDINVQNILIHFRLFPGIPQKCRLLTWPKAAKHNENVDFDEKTFPKKADKKWLFLVTVII